MHSDAQKILEHFTSVLQDRRARAARVQKALEKKAQARATLATGGIVTPAEIQEATEEEILQQENAERREKGEAHIRDFATQELDDDAQAPLAPDTMNVAIEFRPTKGEEVRARMMALWDDVKLHVTQMETNAQDFPATAKDHVWAVYTREIKLETLEELLFSYVMAQRAFRVVSHKVDEQEFFDYYFAKVRVPVMRLRDDDNCTLLHYICLLDRNNIELLYSALDAFAERAREQLRQRTAAGESSPDLECNMVRALFKEVQNAAGDSVLGMVERAGYKAIHKRCVDRLEWMYSLEGDEHTVSDEDADKPAVQRVFNRQDKDYNPAFLEQLLTDKDRRGAAVYVRIKATEIDPDEVIRLHKEKGEDLFAVDLRSKRTTDLGGFRNKNASSVGALSNHYAKQGMFNLNFAKRKLVIDDGVRSQGHRDERGYNTYMQMAAMADISVAFMQNENEFWDHILRRMALHHYQSKAAKGGRATLRETELRICRDVLDMPGNDGRTALHLAAHSGNVEALNFVLRKLLSLFYAEEYRRVLDAPPDPKRLAAARQPYLTEMRDNLAYLTSVDNNNYNPWMLAVMANRKEVLMTMVGMVDRYPEYMEVIARLPVQPGRNAEPISLSDFAGRAYGDSATINEAGRYLRGVLRDAAHRAQAKKDGGRVIRTR